MIYSTKSKNLPSKHQVQVQKPNQVVAKDQMSDHTENRE